MTQPEALRLAAALQQQAVWEGHYGPSYLRDLLPEAAAELRRLHEAHDWQYRMAGERLRRIEKLEAQQDALLAALKEIYDWIQPDETVWAVKARAAIRAVES